MSEFVALLRGINVGGHRKMPMAELRALCADIGFENAQSYIQSGNLVFAAPGKAEEQETKLTQAIENRFGFDVPIIVRKAAEWHRYIADNPFDGDPDVSPKMLHLLLASGAPGDKAAETLAGRAVAGERVRRAGDAIWIDYANGAGRSKLTPKLIDTAFGASATARNLNTVLKLQEMLEERTA